MITISTTGEKGANWRTLIDLKHYHGETIGDCRFLNLLGNSKKVQGFCLEGNINDAYKCMSLLANIIEPYYELD